uniref:Poly [ADP-ribose] polymerase n=1 Tax=Amphimedon queenslandica TaxID=400682 RepID=A0A1X7V7C7_AMPQE
MMSGSYPLTIESIFDYLSSSVADVISWSFFDGQFKPMSPTDSAEIEKLYQQFLHQAASHAGSQLPYSRKIGEWNYSYDFDGMVQTNTKTRKKRKIKRIPALDSFSLCLSCRGLKDSVHTSIASLHEKLKGMIIKKTFGDCSTDIVEPIIKLARSFCVKVDSSLDSIVISGGSDYLAKVFLVLRQKQMSLESTSLLSFPPEWEPQTENIELKSVPVSSSEGAKVVSAFKKTMNSNISKIERIQNKFLYTKYDLCKKRMHEKNNGRVNEKWLFHGSRSVPPETIYKSEHGFDFRHAGQNCLWGRGAYFAVNANIAMQSNRLLVTPPRKEDGSGDYDSVNGVTGLSQIYIVYDHDKCYPAYLVTFQQ